MTYSFEKLFINEFKIYKTNANLGNLHKKQFTIEKTTPLNQSTLNIYASSFLFEIPSINFKQELLAGQSSLDISLLEYPTLTVCTEAPSTNNAIRYCVGPTDSTKLWKRYYVSLNDNKVEYLNNVLVFACSEGLFSNTTLIEPFTFIETNQLTGKGKALIMEIIQ